MTDEIENKDEVAAVATKTGPAADGGPAAGAVALDPDEMGVDAAAQGPEGFAPWPEDAVDMHGLTEEDVEDLDLACLSHQSMSQMITLFVEGITGAEIGGYGTDLYWLIEQGWDLGERPAEAMYRGIWGDDWPDAAPELVMALDVYHAMASGLIALVKTDRGRVDALVQARAAELNLERHKTRQVSKLERKTARRKQIAERRLKAAKQRKTQARKTERAAAKSAKAAEAASA